MNRALRYALAITSLSVAVVAAPAGAAVAPVGAGYAIGWIGNEGYGGVDWCLLRLNISGRMPTSTNVVTVTDGIVRGVWDCGTDSDVGVTIDGQTPSGPRHWDCLGHVSGANSTYEGFSSLTTKCRTQPGGALFTWRLPAFVRGTETAPDPACDRYRPSCNTTTLSGAYVAKGVLA
jgi:hypothetical protein